MKNLWKHHAKYYDLFQNNSTRYRNIIEIFLQELKECDKILDTGAGSGNLTLELLKQGHKVVAIDLDKFSLEILRKKCAAYSKNLNVLQMDVQALSFKHDEFDGVSSMFVIPFVKNNKKYFSEVYRVLKKKGKFTISTWAPIVDSWYGIIGLQTKELEQKKILPKYQKEWNYTMESAKIAINDVLKGSNLEKLKIMLKKAGFKNIKEYPNNSYGKYAYFLSCEK